MTITEALAEIKTILKRIQSKREFVETYQLRVDTLKDPLEKDGGSQKAVEAELQAIADLEGRIVTLRKAIQAVNDTTPVTIEGVEKTIADWLIWRREIAPAKQQFISKLTARLASARSQLHGSNAWNSPQQPESKADLIVNMDEAALSKSKEQLSNILGQLDGQLSLKNATVQLALQ